MCLQLSAVWPFLTQLNILGIANLTEVNIMETDKCHGYIYAKNMGSENVRAPASHVIALVLIREPKMQREIQLRDEILVFHKQVQFADEGKDTHLFYFLKLLTAWKSAMM